MFRKWQKVWLIRQGEKLPAIIKDVDRDLYYLHVFYDGFWHDDVSTIERISERTEDISETLFALRKHLLDGSKI